jgi:hypothetical protein
MARKASISTVCTIHALYLVPIGTPQGLDREAGYPLAEEIHWIANSAPTRIGWCAR